MDLDSERKVSYEEAMKYATAQGVPYFEVSAKTGFNVDLMIQAVVDDLYEHLELLDKTFKQEEYEKNLLIKHNKKKESGCPIF